MGSLKQPTNFEDLLNGHLWEFIKQMSLVHVQLLCPPIEESSKSPLTKRQGTVPSTKGDATWNTLRRSGIELSQQVLVWRFAVETDRDGKHSGAIASTWRTYRALPCVFVVQGRKQKLFELPLFCERGHQARMVDFVRQTWSMLRAFYSTRYLGYHQVGDKREERLLKFVLEKAENNSESVLKTIDQYAKTCWLMNIGDVKGAILRQSLAETKPKFVLELGAYIGYSATLICSQLEADGKLASLDVDPNNANIARQIVQHAGFREKYEVVEGILFDKVEDLKKLLHSWNATKFDFVLIDHDKDCYLPDVLLLKEHGLIGKGTTLFADNVGFPGSPTYRKYILEHTDKYETVAHKTQLEYYKLIGDTVLISTCK